MTHPPFSATRAAAALLLVLAGAAALDVPGCAPRRKPDTPPSMAAARRFYESQPRFLRPILESQVPEGLPDLRAETCGKCHPAMYEEWRLSTHARAWLDDPQFVEELKKTTAKPGRDASWICMNCHTPLEAQQPRLVTALENGDRGLPRYVDNPSFDARLQAEAITCATCHVRDGVVLGPWGDTRAPHPVRKSDDLVSAGLCTDCHQAQENLSDVELACLFDTGSSFAAGPWAREGKICQSCHMPEIERPIATTSSVARKTRRHWFGGSLIPKKPEFEDELVPVRTAYRDGARVEWVDLPEFLPAGRPSRIAFAITNAEAGHTLPTGDVERFLLVTARAVAPDGTLLGERTERIGMLYRWYPAIEKLADTRLEPLETRTYVLEFTAPPGGSVSLLLDGSNHRMSRENFDYHSLEGRGVASREFMSSVTNVPLR